MTRRLRPPAPLQVRCCTDGSPRSLRRGGRDRRVTHVAASWVRPSLWWEDASEVESEHSVGGDGFYGERTYYRLVLEGTQILEVFATRSGTWYLERIID